MTVNEPKKNPTDSKTSNPKSSAENPKTDKSFANTQTVPEKEIKDSRNQETRIEDKRKAQTKGKTVETQEKSSQTVVLKDEIIQAIKSQSTFNMQSEISKLKIVVPLAELAKNDLYRSMIF